MINPKTGKQLTAIDVKEYLRSKGLYFPEFPEDRPQIIAGGAIANAIINIVHEKNVPINDLDIFVYSNHETLGDSVATFDEDAEYPGEMTKRLQIADRVTVGNWDFIHMNVLDKYQYLLEVTPIEFYNTVLASFDLNCTQAGIYYDDREGLRLLVTLDFVNFLSSQRVEVVNVHSIVTIARMIKKAYDLEVDLDLEQELKIIAVSCNPDNLKGLTEEQEKKHGAITLGIPYFRSQLLRLNHTEMKDLYDGFAYLGEYNQRQIKVRIARDYLTGDKYAKDAILSILEYGNVAEYIKLL